MVRIGMVRTRVALAAIALSVTSAHTLLAQGAVNRAADTAFAVAANAVIEITMRRGDLVVRGSDRATAELRTVNRDYQLRSSGVTVMLAMTSSNGRNTRTSSYGQQADVELLVPRSVRLIVHGTSGDVTITDVIGDVEVHVQSGEIVGKALGGRAIFESLSGDITVADGVGDVRLSTVSGDVHAQQVRGSVEVSSTSGDIVLASPQFSRAEVVTTSGEISLSGALSSDATIQLTSHSGDIALRFPESGSGVLSVSSFRGTVSGDRLTLLPTTDRSSRNDRDGATRRYQFGDGGNARIIISTFTGDVVLQRGPSTRSRRDRERQYERYR